MAAHSTAPEDTIKRKLNVLKQWQDRVTRQQQQEHIVCVVCQSLLSPNELIPHVARHHKEEFTLDSHEIELWTQQLRATGRQHHSCPYCKAYLAIDALEVHLKVLCTTLHS